MFLEASRKDHSRRFTLVPRKAVGPMAALRVAPFSTICGVRRGHHSSVCPKVAQHFSARRHDLARRHELTAIVQDYLLALSCVVKFEMTVLHLLRMWHNATLTTTCLTSPPRLFTSPRAPQPTNTNTNNGNRGEPEGSNGETRSGLNVHTRTPSPAFEPLELTIL